MADLATLGAAHAAGLTGAEGREVVVVHVALAVDRLDSVEALPLVEHAQGADGEHLGLAALEEAGAVDQRQVVALDVEGTHLVRATAVHAQAGLDHGLTHGVLLELLELHGDGAGPLVLLLLAELGADALLEVGDLGLSGLLVGALDGDLHLVHVGEDTVVHLGDRLVELVLADGQRAVGLDDLVEELLLLLAEGGDGLLAKGHGCEHVLLGDLVGAGLEHGDVGGGTRELEVEVGVVLLLIGRVDDELLGVAVAADADARQRTLEGHAAHSQRGGGAHDRDGVDRVDLVGDQGHRDDLDLVAEAVGEGRAQRAVDHAGRERGLLGGTGLTLEVAAGDAADRVHLLDEVDRQGEEVVVLALLGDDDGHVDGGVAALDEALTRRLLGELTGLERVVLAVEVELVCNFCHVFSLSPPALCRWTASRGSLATAGSPLWRPLLITREAPAGTSPDSHLVCLTGCCRGCRGS